MSRERSNKAGMVPRTYLNSNKKSSQQKKNYKYLQSSVKSISNCTKTNKNTKLMAKVDLSDNSGSFLKSNEKSIKKIRMTMIPKRGNSEAYKGEIPNIFIVIMNINKLFSEITIL